ncbi:hypothetical protein V493_02569, partial [Pseudogymnoascus sp. VKM F-4281 (FW-2241)]
TPGPSPPDIEKVFGPFYSLLDQYETVLDKNGSVAVATGYRSIARKLLDRLENVFARELSAEGCTCIMCTSDPDGRLYHARALGWGDVLEWVSGRRSLPPYPAFDYGATTRPRPRLGRRPRMGERPAQSPPLPRLRFRRHDNRARSPFLLNKRWAPFISPENRPGHRR